MKYLAALLLALMSLPAWTAGVIDAFEGEVRVISPQANRAASVGLAIAEGNVIRTGTDAWVLLEMADGAVITVRPVTELRIETYRYQPKDVLANQRSVIALAYGALRVITGLIGNTNRAGYAVNTPMATIGIRGTDHETAFMDARRPENRQAATGTYDKVYSGATVLRNRQGEIQVAPGQIGFADAAARTAPQRLAREPEFLRANARIDQRAEPRRQRLQRSIEERSRGQSGRRDGDEGERGESSSGGDRDRSRDSRDGGNDRDRVERNNRDRVERIDRDRGSSSDRDRNR